MDKYKKYLGIIIFLLMIALTIALLIMYLIMPTINSYNDLKAKEESTTNILNEKKQKMEIIQNKRAELKQSVLASQKKIYSPVENNLGNDTLFFTLYSDIIEMVHSNSIKIDSIEYNYNPTEDIFVQQGEIYFVCDVNLKLVSNYVNLGKLVQDLYQYPYYIKINSIEVSPYPKDKKILLTSMSVRLYAHTEPVTNDEEDMTDINQLDNATTSIPGDNAQ